MKKIAVDDPATLETLTEVSTVDSSGIEQAITAAAEAFPAWSRNPEKSSLLARWSDLIENNRDDLAVLLTLENGKPLAESRREIQSSAAFFRYYARLPWPEETIISRGNLRHLVRQVPVGVCAAITPWNFSSSMLARKLAPALAAGCTVIAKPASETPLSGLALLELGREAGIPPGVINGVIAEDTQSAGKLLCSHPLIRKLGFTGSTRVGRLLMEQAAGNLTRLSLELGGHAALLMLPEAEIEKTVAGAIASRFRNAGQTCICVNRMFIPQARFAQVLQELRLQLRKLRLGHGLDPDTTLGPMINPAARSMLNSRLTKESVEFIACEMPELPGAFMPPCLVINPTSSLSQEEIFGPCLVLHAYEGVEEAVERINSSAYGLAAYVYGETAKAWQIAEQLQVGMVGVNETNGISTCEAPFGGCKQSGFGREGGREGLEEYLQTQTITLHL